MPIEKTRVLILAPEIKVNDTLCSMPRKKGDHKVMNVTRVPMARVVVQFEDGDVMKKKWDAAVYVRVKI